jgi:hypothetical protein
MSRLAVQWDNWLLRVPMDETDEKRIAGNLAKIMGLMCLRNTMIEDIHDGVVPVGKMPTRLFNLTMPPGTENEKK